MAESTAEIDQISGARARRAEFIAPGSLEMAGRLRQDVQSLTSLDRRTTSPGEQRSAGWIIRRLGEIGVDDARPVWFRSQSSWAPVNLGHILAAIAAGLVPGVLGSLLTAAVTASYEMEVSGRNNWMRRLIPAKLGTTVTARIPTSGDARRTIVLVAHHDAAHNGIVWHPRTIALNRLWSRRTGDTMPSHLPVLAAMAAGTLPVRAVRTVARVMLATAGLAMTQSMRSYTTPGANDNATGVAAVLEIARELTAEPLPNTDVLVVFPGGEEAGNTGMRAWVNTDGRQLDPDNTLVINLDSLGSGGHLVVARREGLTGRADATDVEMATAAASAIGVKLQQVSFPNVCDATIARHKGLHAISLLSYDSGWIRNLHMKSDTVEEVCWNTVLDAVDLTRQLAIAWSTG